MVQDKIRVRYKEILLLVKGRCEYPTVQRPSRHSRLNLGWDTTMPPKGGVLCRDDHIGRDFCKSLFVCESTSRVSNDAVRSVVARQDTHRRERAGVYGM